MRIRVSLSLAWTFPALLAAASAGAQRVPDDRFTADRFVPAAGPDNYLELDGAAVSGHLTLGAAVLIDYAHRPLVIEATSCRADDSDCGEQLSADLVQYEISGTVTGSLSLFERVQVGLAVPVTGSEGESFRASTPNFDEPYIDLRGGKALGLADPRLSVKVRLAGETTRGFALAAAAYVSAPLGQATAQDRWLGDDGVAAGGQLIAELRAQGFRAAANVGGGYRPEARLLAIEVGPELRYGAAAGYAFTPLLRVLAELVGSTRFAADSGGNPLELRAAGALDVDEVTLTLGAGAGLVTGVGAPDFRVLLGAGYYPAAVDNDADGVPVPQDLCPAAPEDKDGYVDDDGCPDLDNDADGIDDALDRCPDEPEDKDGTADDDGCPDNDNDGDGIEDGYDSCPETPEDKDGDRDEDGCPDDDRDRDGVPDDVDQCPDEVEDTDGFGDEDGCPETDFDGDQLSDEDDLCPDQPEDFNGVDDEDGCPDGAPAEPERAPDAGGAAPDVGTAPTP